MKREFLLNILLLLGINLLVKPLYIFGVDLQIQNLVGESSYGMYKVLFNIAFLLQFIHEPGIQSFNSQNIAKNRDSLGFHLPRILGLKFILGIIYFIFSLGYFLLNDFDSSLLLMMVIITINLFLSTLFLYLRTNIAAIGKYRMDSLLSSLDKLLMLFILGFLVWNPSTRSDFQIIWLAYGQFAAFLISCIVALLFLSKSLHRIQLKVSWDYSKKLLKWSLPYALILLTMSAYTRMDSIMLEALLDDGGLETGKYEYGYRFLDALNMIGYMFAALLVPMYASNLKKTEVLSELLNMGMRLMTFITVLGATLFIAYRSEIMDLAKGQMVESYYGDILIYLMLSFVMISLAYLFGSLIVATNKVKSFNILLISGVAINFLLNYYFIPDEKALGAAKSTLITQCIMTIGQIFLVRRLTDVKIDKKLLVVIVLFGLLCALIFWGVRSNVDIYWIYKAILSILISGIVALLLGLIRVEMFVDLMTKNKPSTT